MHSSRLLFALIACLALSSNALAQTVDMYFSYDGATIAPDNVVDATSCTLALPCQFGSTVAPWSRYYTGQSIRAIFINAGASTIQETHFGCSGHLTLEFLPGNAISFASNVYFGNSTHRVQSISITNSRWVPSTTNTVFAFAQESVLVETSKLEFTMHFDLLPGGSVRIVDSDISFSSASTGIVINSTATLSSVTFENSGFHQALSDFFHVVAPKIENLEMVGLFFEAVISYEPYLLTRPNSAPQVLVDSFELRDCDLSPISQDEAENLQIQSHYTHVESVYFGDRSFLFEGTNEDGSYFESYYNEFRGNGILSVSAFQYVEFVGNYIDGYTIKVGDPVPALTFESHSDVFFSSNGNEFAATASVWFDDLYSENLYLKATSGSDGYTAEATFTYCSMLRDDGALTPDQIIARDVFVYESYWLPLRPYSSIIPVLTIHSDPPHITTVHGNAIIDALEWGCNAGSCVFSNEAELHFSKSMRSNAFNVTVYNNGILAFHSDSETCQPTSISGLKILPPTDPASVSVFSTYVWSLGATCAGFYMQNSVIFDQADHLLEVVIENGEIGSPVDGSSPIQLVKVNALTNPGYVNNPWGAVYPSEAFPFDPEYNFTGTHSTITTTNAHILHYNVTSFFCAKACSGNGQCVGVDTCSCDPTYSGYTCGCHNLPTDVYCSADEDDLWLTPSDLLIGSSSSFEFPDQVGGDINGTLTNGGILRLNDARYDIAGALKNNGEIKIVSTVSQVRNGTATNNGCIFVPTSRSFAKDITLSQGSIINVELDLASASTSKCPSADPQRNPIFSTPIANTPTAKRDSFDIIRAITTKRANLEMSSSSSRSINPNAASNSRASKSKSLLEAENSRSVNGTMKVTITTPPSEQITMTLFASRNATNSKGVDNTAQLLVEVSAPAGTCTTLQQKPNLVILFASPCANTPETSPSKQGKLKWYYYGAPIIAVAGLLFIFLILVFTVPAVRRVVLPYSGART